MRPSALALVASRGVVSEFDESVGLGVITSVDGVELPFHCIAISDGSRKIEVGASVAFRVFPAVKGRVEASFVEKI